MLRKIIYGSCWLLCCCWSVSLFAQSNCQPDNEEQVVTQGDVVLDYGSTTNAFSFRNRSDIIVGQAVTGRAIGRANIAEFGFYTRRLLPPQPPIVKATQGELLDRIQLNWEVDPLSPAPNDGFNIYRDGIYLENVGNDVRTFNDFNVIAGRPYNYAVRGVNAYGEGFEGKALGFQVPNGTVTGIVQTPNGSPVPNALITLTPMQGFSARFEANAGAYADIKGTNRTSLLPDDNHWSITFWMQSEEGNNDGNATILELHPSNLKIQPLTSEPGVSVILEDGTSIKAAFPDTLLTDWNHIGLTFDGRQLRLYMDGVLADLVSHESSELTNVTELRFGAAGTPGWNGRLDEFRIYHRVLDELDYDNVKNGTASTITPDLMTYWKMDEEQGTKSFDLMERSILYFCGATFDESRPPVRIAGVTNEDGYYRIDAASYGTGTTFLAHPSKNFYKQRALKFVREEKDYALLPDFSVTDKATLELWLNTAGPDGEQCVLSKTWQSNQFQIRLVPSPRDRVDYDVVISINGTNTMLGQLGMGYQHLAFTIDQDAGEIQAYKNGESLGSTINLPSDYGAFSDSLDVQSWFLGACTSGMDTIDYFGGLIAEVALYDTLFPQTAIQEHVENSRDPQEKDLRVYYSLNEGNGDRLNNSGSLLLDRGHPYGASWSNFAPNQETTPHELTPNSRQVTLNPSITSVDQVDFVDRSTVPVSGFVRYRDTECFAQQVEILVNGEQHSPRIFTDSTGRFVIDFDPGESAILTPKFEDHQFSPAFWEVTNLINPIAGVLFNDITTRTVSGQVAGGDCKRSIIKAPPGTGQGTVAIVKLRSTDGCYEREITIDNQEGNYEFKKIPPLEELTVSVVEHSDPEIKTAFETSGGSTINLTQKDTIIDFIFYAKPEVKIESPQLVAITEGCDKIVLDKDQNVSLNIGLQENYTRYSGIEGEVCPLDTASLTIVNGIADETIDTTMSNGVLEYQFKVGVPNPSPPYLKTLQVIGTSLANKSADKTEQVIVTGIFQKDATFTTTLPETPSLILRDPPGDGSYSYLEKNVMHCTTLSIGTLDQTNSSYGITGSLGPDFEIALAPLGVGENTPIETTIDVAEGLAFQEIETTENNINVCTTYSTNIATSDDSNYIGEDADLYMGSAIDLKIGFADKVKFDPALCEVQLDTIINVEPGNPTTFIYSQTYIENYVLGYLENVVNNTSVQDTMIINDSRRSIELWKGHIARNKQLKADAEVDVGMFPEHISFDATTNYAYSITLDSTNTNETSEEETDDGYFYIDTGAKLQGIGLVVNIKKNFINGTTNAEGTIDENSTSIGFVLADDDPNDAFSVAIKADKVYNTPVFELFSGQSSCPHEEGTAKREVPNLAIAEGGSFVANNVLSNEKAIFELQLGNASDTNEDMTYGITVVPGSNPDGAVVQLNGTTLNGSPIPYLIPNGTSTKVTLTIGRGPRAYEYEDIEVALYSMCEYELDLALGRPPREEFFKIIRLGVNFIQPCSEVEINVPSQNFVVRNDDPRQPGTIRRITASGYDLNIPDFQLVRTQYRLTNGDGTWINLPTPSGKPFEAYNPNWSGFNGRTEIGADTLTLDASFTQFEWETDGLGDGDYEVRAIAVCTGDAASGFSELIQGRIDRQPPSLVGLPEPSDGVYHVGDEISFTFNKHINCDKLIAADRTQSNNVGLYDSTTGELIDIEITCYENKIIISPNFENKFFENKVLRAELHNIEDLTGNVLVKEKWEFYVDRNELAWLSDRINFTKYRGEGGEFTATIHNRGGYPVPYSIQDIPDWLHIVPDQDTLVANERLEVHFEINPVQDVSILDSVTLHTEAGLNPFFMGGDEHLPIDLRVLSRPPVWESTPSLLTMGIIGELIIDGVASEDSEDMLAVFVNGVVRGVANVQKVDIEQADESIVMKHLVFLDMHIDENLFAADDEIEFKVWDASKAEIHTVLGSMLPTRIIEACNEDAAEITLINSCETIFGTLAQPEQLNVFEFAELTYELEDGWNWLSFPYIPTSPNDIGSFIRFKLDDFIDHSSEQAIEINSAVLLSKGYESDELTYDPMQNEDRLYWDGYLTERNRGLNARESYRLFVEKGVDFSYSGSFASPNISPIPIVGGEWNWIGFVSRQNMDLTTALYSLDIEDGDILKGQDDFAVFEGGAWRGTLTRLEPQKGYLLYPQNAGRLVYPDTDSGNLTDPNSEKVQADLSRLAKQLKVPKRQYRESMSLVAAIGNCSKLALEEELYLAAYVGEECRGIAAISRVGKQNVAFLTVHGAAAESVHFKLLQGAEKQQIGLLGHLPFEANQLLGMPSQPYLLEIADCALYADVSSGSSVEQRINRIDIYPNPFDDQIVMDFGLEQTENIRVLLQDINAKIVAEIHDDILERGNQRIVWKSAIQQKLPSGVYFLTIQSDTFYHVEKMVK